MIKDNTFFYMKRIGKATRVLLSQYGNITVNFHVNDEILSLITSISIDIPDTVRLDYAIPLELVFDIGDSMSDMLIQAVNNGIEDYREQQEENDPMEEYKKWFQEEQKKNLQHIASL